MYPVSDGFLRAVKSNTRKYYWTGTIVTKGGMTYELGAKEIVKGSGYISRQCCGSTEIELGTVYAAEMGITLLSDIDRLYAGGCTGDAGVSSGAGGWFGGRCADGSF